MFNCLYTNKKAAVHKLNAKRYNLKAIPFFSSTSATCSFVVWICESATDCLDKAANLGWIPESCCPNVGVTNGPGGGNGLLPETASGSRVVNLLKILKVKAEFLNKHLDVKQLKTKKWV